MFNFAVPSHPHYIAIMLYMCAHMVLSIVDMQPMYWVGILLSAMIYDVKQRIPFCPVLTPWGIWL